MTDTAVDPVASPAPPARPSVRRWRLLLPVFAALALIVFTLVAAWVESPSPGSARFLSPEAAGDHGGSRLADRLADEGVSVSRYTEADDEFFDAVGEGEVTIFVPAPDYLNSRQLSRLYQTAISENVRLVLVDPSRKLLGPLGLAEAGAARIAPRVVGSGTETGQCGLDEARAAGSANMLRQAYTEAKSSLGPASDLKWNFCYQDGLAWAGDENLSFVVAGAPDPFTDAYFDRANNAELATALLGKHQRVLWLDKHEQTVEPPPSAPPPPSGDYEQPEPTRYPIEYPDSASTNPLYDALPSWMWASLVGLLVLGVGLALWKGRRLGPPVTEPLPTTVPAAETVYGRARLYRRAGAYPETLRALRAGALHRIQPVLGLSSQAGRAETVAAVVERTGWSSQYVAATLYETRPGSETELLDATSALDALVTAVETNNPQGRTE